MPFVILVALAIAIAGVLFAMQNAVPVTVSFLAWRFDSSLALVLLLAMGCGVLAMLLWSVPAVLRARWQLARQRRRIARLEAEAEELRAAARPEPLSGPATGRAGGD